MSAVTPVASPALTVRGRGASGKSVGSGFVTVASQWPACLLRALVVFHPIHGRHRARALKQRPVGAFFSRRVPSQSVEFSTQSGDLLRELGEIALLPPVFRLNK